MLLAEVPRNVLVRGVLGSVNHLRKIHKMFGIKPISGDKHSHDGIHYEFCTIHIFMR